MAPRRTRRQATHATETFALPLPDGAGTVEVAVTRKRVKNLNLRVGRGGQVRMSAPLGTPDAAIRAFLERRAEWIAAHVARQQERTHGSAPLAAEELRATVPLWGTLIDTSKALAAAGLLPPARPPRARTFGSFTAQHAADTRTGEPSSGTNTPFAGYSTEELERLIQELYRHEVERVLPEVAAQAEQRMGVSAKSWQVRCMTSRWGSCTPARQTIRISSALAAYPPACLEMVVVHELVHLLEPSHNARFHALLDRFCPDNRTLGKLLRQPPRAVANP